MDHSAAVGNQSFPAAPVRTEVILMARALPTNEPAERANDSNLAVLAPDDRSLRLHEAGLNLIRRRLEAANRDNPNFAAQRDRLFGAVSMALDGLLRHFAPEIERVVALGEWALHGVDLRTLAEAEDIVLEIVVRADRRDFDFDQRASTKVFADVQDAYAESFLLQYTVLPLPLWRRSLEFRRATGRDEGAHGVPLLVRE
jgi:hypothetical protein